MGHKVSKNTNYSQYVHKFFCLVIGHSGDYYLLMGYEKSWFWALIAIFGFWALLGPKKGVAPQILIWAWDF